MTSVMLLPTDSDAVDETALNSFGSNLAAESLSTARKFVNICHHYQLLFVD